jgi:hypothetical protein
MTLEEKKEAKRLYDMEYRKKNKLRISKQQKARYNALSDEERLIINKNKYEKLDKEKKKKKDKEYAIKNKEKLNLKKKLWGLENPEKHKKAKYGYVKKMMSTDILYKLKRCVSASINQSLKKKGFYRKSRSYEILGCSYEEFKTHIESKFEQWMNWKNRGNWNGVPKEINTAWDIDHILPLSSAMCEEDVIKLNHYTNLQPLCSYTNRNIKRDQY